LHIAAANDQEDVVKLLVVYKADLKAMDNRGRTPLQRAVAPRATMIWQNYCANTVPTNRALLLESGAGLCVQVRYSGRAEKQSVTTGFGWCFLPVPDCLAKPQALLLE
jgi:hypothetical protein